MNDGFYGYNLQTNVRVDRIYCTWCLCWKLSQSERKSITKLMMGNAHAKQLHIKIISTMISLWGPHKGLVMLNSILWLWHDLPGNCGLPRTPREQRSSVLTSMVQKCRLAIVSRGNCHIPLARREMQDPGSSCERQRNQSLSVWWENTYLHVFSNEWSQWIFTVSTSAHPQWMQSLSTQMCVQCVQEYLLGSISLFAHHLFYISKNYISFHSNCMYCICIILHVGCFSGLQQRETETQKISHTELREWLSLLWWEHSGCLPKESGALVVPPWGEGVGGMGSHALSCSHLLQGHFNGIETHNAESFNRPDKAD